jgi:NAD(P) transhydrogenase
LDHYDLIVIGSGPAGEKGAATARFFGKNVALVERSPVLGGASTNTGTIPSKTLRETALALSGTRARKLYGVDLSLRHDATIPDLMYHEERVKKAEEDRVGDVIHDRAIDLYHGQARFVDPHTVLVKHESGSESTISAEKLLIATGSSPVHPSRFNFDDPRILDSDTILRIENLPKRLAVIGAGVIGSEYACTFAALGREVHMIDKRQELLPFLDNEVSAALEEGMKQTGVTFHWNEEIASCDIGVGGTVLLKCTSGSELEVDAVLVAAGRNSNTGELNLSAAGIKPGKRGLIETDEHYRTSVPHIYAAGDVIGFPALAATSAEQARVAMCHAFDKSFFKERIASILPTGIYTIPEVGMIGETEESLIEKKVDYVVGHAPYRLNARGQIIGDNFGFLKLLFATEDMKLVGVHAIGEQATELVHIGLIAMLANCRAEVFNLACFNYPTLGELYKYATYSAFVRRGGERVLSAGMTPPKAAETSG